MENGRRILSKHQDIKGKRGGGGGRALKNMTSK